MKNKHGKKRRRKRESNRKAIERLPRQIKNKIGQVEQKLGMWLYSTYKVILIPKFNVKAMSVRKDGNVLTKTVRGVLC